MVNIHGQSDALLCIRKYEHLLHLTPVTTAVLDTYIMHFHKMFT